MIASVGSLLKGVVAGAGFMYFFDPDRGRRRRAGVANRAVRLLHDSEGLWNRGLRDLKNRATGLAAETKRVVTEAPPDDRVLAARVRAALGHVIRDAKAVEVSAQNGMVTLRGTVRPGEPELLIPAVEHISGVRGVESGLTAAGEPVAPPPRIQELTPGVKLLLTAGGSLFLANGLLRRGVGPTLLGTAGAAMLVRSLADRPGGLLGTGPDGAIRVRKSVRVDAPVEKVYEFVADVEQSGRFLPHVAKVEPLGDGRVRWTIDGPAGIGRLTCEEQVLEAVDNSRIVWGSADGAPIRYVCDTRFVPDGEGTRLDVRLTYHPPGGTLGNAAASFFGVDPKTQLELSLHRIKQYFEEGAVPRGAAGRSVREHRG